MFTRTIGAFALIAALMAASAVVAGDSAIMADPTAPGAQQPIVLPTGSGLPQVNIAATNATIYWFIFIKLTKPPFRG
jgi:hypothetical protein